MVSERNKPTMKSIPNNLLNALHEVRQKILDQHGLEVTTYNS